MKQRLQERVFCLCRHLVQYFSVHVTSMRDVLLSVCLAAVCKSVSLLGIPRSPGRMFMKFGIALTFHVCFKLQQYQNPPACRPLHVCRRRVLGGIG